MCRHHKGCLRWACLLCSLPGEQAFRISAGQAASNRPHLSWHLNPQAHRLAVPCPACRPGTPACGIRQYEVPASCRFAQLTFLVLQVSGEALSFKQAAQAFREVKGEIKVQLLSYASAFGP